jgi:flagellar hook-basal body complex protein FliE
MISITPLELLRTNPAHVGTSPLKPLKPVSSNLETERFQVKDEAKSNKSSFQDYFLEAINYVNNKQIAQTNISNQLITDPDSVDIHDVTIAMAEANLSLNMAQNVIDRIIKGWNEITTTR